MDLPQVFLTIGLGDSMLNRSFQLHQTTILVGLDIKIQMIDELYERITHEWKVYFKWFLVESVPKVLLCAQKFIYFKLLLHP